MLSEWNPAFHLEALLSEICVDCEQPSRIVLSESFIFFFPVDLLRVFNIPSQPLLLKGLFSVCIFWVTSILNNLLVLSFN